MNGDRGECAPKVLGTDFQQLLWAIPPRVSLQFTDCCPMNNAEASHMRVKGQKDQTDGRQEEFKFSLDLKGGSVPVP